MKNNTGFSLVCLFVLTFCSSCAVKHLSAFTPIKEKGKPLAKTRPKKVYVFYEGDSLKFHYKRLGFAEIECRPNEKPEESIDRLKYTAFKNSANALIGVKTEKVLKNYGGAYRTGSKTYVALFYKGTAVQILDDSLFRSNKFDNTADLGFVKNVMRYNHKHQNKANQILAASVLFSALLIGIYALTIYY
jgi:hypothetical protein